MNEFSRRAVLAGGGSPRCRHLSGRRGGGGACPAGAGVRFQGSHLAYSGPYYVDEARWTVDQEMFVSLFPNWKGQRQVGIVKLDGDDLQLSTDLPALFNGSLKT